MKDFPLIAMAGVAAVVSILLYLAQRQRSAKIRNLAGRLGFHYIGGAFEQTSN